MEERWKKLMEYLIEAGILAWLGYLFLYQNYLLHNWHRGLPLPSREPYRVLGILLGMAYLLIAVWRNRETFFRRTSDEGSAPDRTQPF